MTTIASQAPAAAVPGATEIGCVGGPVAVAWREGTLTKARELESLCELELANRSPAEAAVLRPTIACHLDAARQAARRMRLEHRKWPRRSGLFRTGPLIERAISNLDAAEANLLSFASARFVLGQTPCLLRHVQCHLPPNDPRRQEFERISRKVGVKDPDHPLLENPTRKDLDDWIDTINQERHKIVAVVRGASSAALREQVRVRSFRNVIVVTTISMTLLAVGVALVGFFRPTMIPLCFAPQEAGEAMVVCPTAQSDRFPVTGPSSTAQPTAAGVTQPTTPPDIDDKIRQNTTKQDLLVVELVGLTAAALAAAAAIRSTRGSSERYGLPVAIAVLKLPTGAITAFLGLLLMRGQFVPGLTALDTSAQILAWALVFGYAQQLFTRLVDRQGQTVLDSVRGADNQPSPPPA